MIDTPPQNLVAILSAARQRIFDDGYTAGYDAGYRAAVDALLQEYRPGDMIPATHSLSPDIIQHQRNVPHLATSDASVTASASLHGEGHSAANAVLQTRSGRAAPGSIKNLVRSFVLTAAGPVAEADFARQYPDVLRPSRYMAFRTLNQEGVIAKQDGRWVPAPVDAVKPDAGASGPVPPADSGGSGD